jgi:outer membrane protein assembly factor BamA
MKVAIMASFAAVGDMNVDTRHVFCIFLAKLKVYCIGYVILGFSIYPNSVVLAQKSIVGITTEIRLGIIERQVYGSDSLFNVSLKLQIEKWQSQGFFLSSIDSVISALDTSTAFLNRGNKFTFVNVDWNDVPGGILIGSNINLNHKKGYSARQFTGKLNQILRYSGTVGFPFAVISLDSLSSKEDDLKVKLRFKQGPYITNDTISFDGLTKTDTNFLARYLHLTTGSPYSEMQFRQIRQRINSLPYLEISKPPYVYFVNGKARIGGEIDELKINSFDGILGLLQNSGDQNLTLTGLVDLELYNLFGTGKELKIGWQQQKALSQTLNLHYMHPLILGSDISIQVDFAQLKQDTSFINRDVGLGFEIPLQKYKVRTAFNRNAGRLLTVVPDRVDIPEIADFNTDYYSLGVEYSSFSKKSFPNKGLYFGFIGSFGQKSIRRNAILSSDFYDSIPTKSPIAKVEFSYHSSMQVINSIYLFHRIQAKAIYNEVLFGNDLFRLGGLNTLRGFNELEFFANQYALSNLELRWLWSEGSYFFLFYDQSVYQINLRNIQNSDQPAGVGIGMVLATKNGIFRLVYSLGSSATQSFNFNAAKVHFGFTSKF